MDFINDEIMEQKRTTPEFITSLEPNEIFVFGSNLRGMHGGGAAYIVICKGKSVSGTVKVSVEASQTVVRLFPKA